MAISKCSAPLVVGVGLVLGCALAAASSSCFAISGGRQASYLRASAPAPAPAPAGMAESGSFFGAQATAAALFIAAGAALARRGATACRAAPADVDLDIPRPENLLESPKFPMFVGSTRGYFSRSTRERHAITWTAKAEMEFEMPIGGWAIMNKGENLCYFRRKEQCIALGKQLRKMKIENYKIYRISKTGEVTFMHPADGVFPEKVNKGRIQVNGRPFTVCQNPQMASVKWTKYHMRPYEADPLTTLFIRAKMQAFADEENLFPIPNYGEKVYGEDAEKLIEATQKAMGSKSV